MSKRRKKRQEGTPVIEAEATKVRSAGSAKPSKPVSSSRGKGVWIAVLIIVAGLACGAFWWVLRQKSSPPVGNAAAALPVALPTNAVAQSLVVAVELDFGGSPPPVAEAIKQIERKWEPADGVGRTFAILDADGWVTNNNKLHLQMHLSMEKPGVGALVFRRTGEVLWKSHIVAASSGPPPEKRLTIIMDDNAGKSVVLDGSKGAARVLDVPLQNSVTLVREAWPDGAEHSFTFIYSVCGCPVKVKVRRTGETTARTTTLPVMFPDDPAALDTISALMGWSQSR
jgi:hypothetical protein